MSTRPALRFVARVLSNMPKVLDKKNEVAWYKMERRLKRENIARDFGLVLILVFAVVGSCTTVWLHFLIRDVVRHSECKGIAWALGPRKPLPADGLTELPRILHILSWSRTFYLCHSMN